MTSRITAWAKHGLAVATDPTGAVESADLLAAWKAAARKAGTDTPPQPPTT